MQKTVYIIPGWTEVASQKRYKKSISLFKRLGFNVIEVKIEWKNKVMSDYVNQFLAMKPKRGSYIFGFSLGAMIAFISANRVKPKTMILCSLSPYFKEDLARSRQIYGKIFDKYFKKRDTDDLKRHSFSKIANRVKCKVIIFAGDKEDLYKGKYTPNVILRAKEAKKMVRNSRLIIVRNGKHDISQPQYHNAIKKVIYKL